MDRLPYKLVDLFAGPGGLSEGFSRVEGRKQEREFAKVIAVEADKIAHQTLTLRAYRRIALQEGDRKCENLYWNYLTDPSASTQFPLHESALWKQALSENGERPLTLGMRNDDSFVEERLKRARLSGDEPWILIGGPPCQAYSLVGRSRMRGKDPAAFDQDHRHVLYREYLRIIQLFRPAVFVMENVKGLLSSRLEGKLIFEQILDDLRRGGMDGRSDDLYEIRSIVVPGDRIDPSQFVVRSELYGVPQARHRVFLLGLHRDIARRLRADGENDAGALRLEPSTPTANEALTTSQAIGDLPRLRARSSYSSLGYGDDPEIRKAFANAIRAARDDRQSWSSEKNRAAARAMTQALRRAAPRPTRKPVTRGATPVSRLYEIYGTDHVMQHVGHIPNHESRGHMPQDLARYLYASAWAKEYGFSPTLADFPRALLPKHNNVGNGAREAAFADRFRVQVACRPSTTITSHISKDGHYFIHYDPSQHRSLSVREAARLQTFPDDYFFEGARTAQYHQVGNAVPPLLAEQIARIVARILMI